MAKRGDLIECVLSLLNWPVYYNVLIESSGFITKMEKSGVDSQVERTHSTDVSQLLTASQTDAANRPLIRL